MKVWGLLGLALLWGGCYSERVGDAMRAMRTGKYVKSLESGNHRIVAYYLPRTLQLINRAGIDSTSLLSDRLLDSIEIANGSAGLAFMLRMEPLDTVSQPGISNDLVYGRISGYATYQEALQAYQFGLKDRIWIEADGEKILMAQYRMENSFGMDPGRNFMLMFGAWPERWRNKKVDVSLVLDDIVPGMARQKIEWTLPVGNYDKKI